jgi:hypothetical protein
MTMNPSKANTERLPRPVRSKRAFIRAAKRFAVVDPQMLRLIAWIEKDPKALGFGATEAPR